MDFYDNEYGTKVPIRSAWNAILPPHAAGAASIMGDWRKQALARAGLLPEASSFAMPGMPQGMPRLPPILAAARAQQMGASGGMGFGGGFQYGNPSQMLGSAQTGVTTVDQMLQQKVYTDIVSGAILTLGPLLLYGLGAVITNFNFRYAQAEQGTTVYIPYWDVLPPVQTLAVDGDEGTPYQMQQSDEQNVVRHGYFGAAETVMAQLFSPFGGMMPSEFQAQMRIRMAEWADSLLLNEAISKTANTALTGAAKDARVLDIYQASGTPRKFRRIEYINGITQRATASANAMAQQEKPVLLIVHVETLGDMMTVNNAIGDMNLVTGSDAPSQPMQISVTSASPTGLMMVPFNIPIGVTANAAFKPAVGAGQLPKYISLAVYEKALAWQQNPQMMMLEDLNIRIPKREWAGHSWAVAHMYKRHNMLDLPGVFAWKHN